MADHAPYRLKGAHALVTGASQGIGADCARALDAAGAKVSVLARNKQKLEALASELAHKAAVAPCDVTDAQAVAQALDAIENEAGAIDILVNNAGSATSAPFQKISQDAWDQMIALNMTSVFRITQRVVKSMQPRGAGRIVNIASTAGLKGYGYVAAYCAAKHGVIGLTRALALELARTGITVNAVCPGYTLTPMLAASAEQIAEKTGRPAQDILDEFASSNPQNRLIETQEVASAVVWLCGEAQGGVTGQALSISGGEVM